MDGFSKEHQVLGPMTSAWYSYIQTELTSAVTLSFMTLCNEHNNLTGQQLVGHKCSQTAFGCWNTRGTSDLNLRKNKNYTEATAVMRTPQSDHMNCGLVPFPFYSLVRPYWKLIYYRYVFVVFSPHLAVTLQWEQLVITQTSKDFTKVISLQCSLCKEKYIFLFTIFWCVCICVSLCLSLLWNSFM